MTDCLRKAKVHSNKAYKITRLGYTETGDFFMQFKRVFTEYVLIAFGALILAVGLNQFLVPVKLSTGGIGSVGTMLFYLFRIPLSVSNLVLNAALFVFGYKHIGRAAVLKTIAGVLFLSLFLALTEGVGQYGEDTLMSALFGGFLCGIGVGLVVRQEGSTGGSDFAALILHKLFPHLSVAVLLMAIDFVIVAVSGLVFQSITVMFYSLLALLVAAKVADGILTVGDVAKSVYILSERYKEIAERVHTQLERGATGVYSRGMYSGREGVMLLCVVKPKELPQLVHLVRDIDKSAFIIISDAREVLGEGFKA